MRSGWPTKEAAQTVVVPWRTKWPTLHWRLKVGKYIWIFKMMGNQVLKKDDHLCLFLIK